MSTLERYSSYKDSGVEWIYDIPEHWEVIKIKHLMYEKKKTHNINLNCGSISFGKVILKDDEKVPPETKKAYQVVQKGDYLINPLNLNYDLKSLRIALSELNVVVSSGYIVLNIVRDINKSYLNWLLHRFDVAFMKTLGAGVRQTLNYTDISRCELIEPPKEEQIKIANFLNKKTAQIDEAIKQKEALISLLKERRQVLIHNAVTQGLDSTVKMKDSGVKWIRKIPLHWEMEKGKWLFKQEKREVNKNDEIITCFRDGEVTLRKNRKTDGFTNALKEHGYQGIRKGDFVIHNMDAFAGAIGVSDSDGKSTPVYSVCTTRKKNVEPLYYTYYLRSLAKQGFIESLAKGIRERSTDFRFNDFGKLLLPVPPKTEQLRIIGFINKNSKKINYSISLKQQQIDMLKEYRGSLIDSCVTGKVKVL